MNLLVEGPVIWKPTEEQIANSNITRFQNWLKQNKNISISNVQELWKWSVDELETFWGHVWEYGEVHSSTPYYQVLSSLKMPGAKWFEGARLNRQC